MRSNSGRNCCICKRQYLSYPRSTLTVGNLDFLTSKKTCENCWRVAVVGDFYGDLTTRNPDETVHHQPLIITLSNRWLNPSEWWGMSTSFHHIPSFAKQPRWSTWSQSTGIGSTPFRKKIQAAVGVSWESKHVKKHCPSRLLVVEPSLVLDRRTCYS